MFSERYNPIISTDSRNVRQEEFTFDEWHITTRKSNILQSMCTCPKANEMTPKDAENQPAQASDCNKVCDSSDSTTADANNTSKCPICIYHEHLYKLPSLPDMVFNKNLLRLQHKTGVSIEFNALDALKQVDETKDPLRVAVADDWQTAAAAFASKIVKPFDWTFTTNYKGSLIGFSRENDDNEPAGGKKIVNFKVQNTSERINMNKLKVKEEILFFDEVPLFEDELADHGVAEHSVKVRVMPSSLFILARFYLRIDNVLARINDTRLYFESTNNYLLREYTNRESNLDAFNLKVSTLINPNELSFHLPLVSSQYEKLLLPS